MELSDLIGRFKGGDKAKPKPFLALELTDEIAAAAVWQVVDGKTDIAALGIPVEWNGDKEDAGELITAVDATISNATEGMGDNINEVIFGIAPSWAGEEGILPAKLNLIKKICKELELKPLGFVVITDSLLRYLKMQEGTPATSILIQVARDTVTVTLVRLGKIVTSEIIGRGDDIASDVEEGISRFQGEDELPSRILVFDGMHAIDEEVQNLISYDWKSKFNFLHIPKIENLPKDVIIRSIAVAGGSEVAKAIGFDIAEPIPIAAPPEPETSEPYSEKIIETEDSVVPVAAESVQELLSAEDFGFTSPTEVAGVGEAPHKKLPPARSVPIATSIKLEPFEETEPEGEKETGDESEEDAEPFQETKPKFAMPALKAPKFTVPKFRLPGLNKYLLLAGGVIAFLCIFAFAFVWLVPKATVTIAVASKDLPEESDITLSTAVSTIDVGNATIPATPVEKVASGEDSVTTTGKKTVGDPATGSVTIYNRTTITKTFAKGTVLTAKSLKFTLDDQVTVASKSAGADYVDVPGKSTVKVTASAIGKDSNIAEDTEFVVENFSKDSYVAKNDNALAGGSSEEIQVVDKVDKANLQKTLLTKLKEQGRAELASELGGTTGVFVYDKGSSIEEETYSADVGKEATALTGSMSVKVKGVSYSTKDVETLMGEALAGAIPSGYTKTGELPVVELGQVKSESDTGVEVTAKITIKLIPEINEETVRTTLRGLSAEDVPGALSSIVGMADARVEITPLWLPTRIKHMPKNASRISVVVVPASQ